jgi:hypothetical protein
LIARALGCTTILASKGDGVRSQSARGRDAGTGVDFRPRPSLGLEAHRVIGPAALFIVVLIKF